MDDGALWPQYSRNEPRYFILNSEVRGVGHGPRATACAFWNEFMPKLSAQHGEFPKRAPTYLRHPTLSLSLCLTRPAGGNRCERGSSSGPGPVRSRLVLVGALCALLARRALPPL